MQHILGLVRRCVEDYNMIEAGETVAVGVSGGKDSLLTLTALARLRAFYPKPFQVQAITLETGMPDMDFSPVADYCEQMDVPYIRIAVPVYDIVFRERQDSLQFSRGRIWVMSVRSRYVTGWKQPMRPSNSRFIKSVSTASS